ncbi:Integrase catalytic domain-containing protein, partial [Aphis craccivora]
MERMWDVVVKSAKSLLHRVIQNTVLIYEELNTVIVIEVYAEVDGIVRVATVKTSTVTGTVNPYTGTVTSIIVTNHHHHRRDTVTSVAITAVTVEISSPPSPSRKRFLGHFGAYKRKEE